MEQIVNAPIKYFHETKMTLEANDKIAHYWDSI